MTFLADIGAHLVTNVTAETLVLGTNVFLNSKPDSPDTAVVLYATAGQEPEHSFGTGAPSWEHWGMQVICRAAGHTTAEALARDVFDVLLLIVNETIGSDLYLRCHANQSPFPLQRDGQNRMEFACNFVFVVA